MADYTRGKIWGYLARRGDWVQRAELVDRYNLSPDTVSKHLQRLVNDGFAEATGETTARRYRAITKYGPPGDRRTHEFRESGTEEGSVKYQRRKARRAAMGKARRKAGRVVDRVTFALEVFWPSVRMT